MTRRIILLALAAFSLPGCFADTNVTDAGLGLPEVTVTFPTEVEPGEIATAVFRIENPGPGAMNGVTITFARVGNDFPIVDAGANGENPAVAGVNPEPAAVDAAGVSFRFEGLEEGASTEILFELEIPDHRGVVANSVTVYASEDLERIEGLRLETTVR